MMTKYHISDKGEAAPCDAPPGKCPKGGEHFDSPEAAQKSYESNMNKSHGITRFKKIKNPLRHKAGFSAQVKTRDNTKAQQTFEDLKDEPATVWSNDGKEHQIGVFQNQLKAEKWFNEVMTNEDREKVIDEGVVSFKRNRTQYTVRYHTTNPERKEYEPEHFDPETL